MSLRSKHLLPVSRNNEIVRDRDRATFIWPWKIKVKAERKQKCKTFNWFIEQKQTSANFHWLGERGCKQRHLSVELSGKFPALWRHLKCSNVIGQSNCLLPILGVSLAGLRRSFVLILPNIGPSNKLRTLFQAHTKVALIIFGECKHSCLSLLEDRSFLGNTFCFPRSEWWVREKSKLGRQVRGYFVKLIKLPCI